MFFCTVEAICRWVFKVSKRSIIIFSSKVRGREFRSHIYFCTLLIDLNLRFFKSHWEKKYFHLSQNIFFFLKWSTSEFFTREYPMERAAVDASFRFHNSLSIWSGEFFGKKPHSRRPIFCMNVRFCRSSEGWLNASFIYLYCCVGV